MKLCKDCIHFREPIGYDSAIPKCYHPQSSIREPIYGRQYNYTPCIIMREATNPCGLEGKLHKTK